MPEQTKQRSDATRLRRNQVMAAVAATGLSSNWKKLQQTLKPRANSDGAALKRKRSAESDAKPIKSSNGRVKKAKTGLDDQASYFEQHRMGLVSSKPQQPRATKSHNAAPKVPSEEAVSRRPSASASRRPSAAASTTESVASIVNQGLHPTHKPGKFLALDCEMVGTGPPPADDNVLARVSIVNFHGEQIYDSYVQPVPGIEVTDYRTFVSGIRPEHLRPDVARPFTEVQKEVGRLLDGKILVGHALKNDLDVLLLTHPKKDVRDTARHPGFRKTSMGRAPALRKLAKEYLGMDIQGGEHSSVEDARATMMLFKLEKDAFEKDVKQQFGAAIRREEKAKIRQEELRKARLEEKTRRRKGVRTEEGSDEDEGDEDDEDDEDDDEEGSDAEAGALKKSKKSKKKKKRKKRTKRA